MISYFIRKRNIRIALSREEPFVRRNAAIWALGESPATPEAIRVLAEVAQRDDELALRQSAINKLASLGEPESLRALLKLIVSRSDSNNWIFIDALRGLRWSAQGLKTIPLEAPKSLLRAGKNVLLWPRTTASERKLQAAHLREMREIVERLQSPGSASVLAELDGLLREIRAAELPALLKTALESGKFEEAESAVEEIAELGTEEARAALARIRRQPKRELMHSYMTDDPNVESGYSPRLATVAKSSDELGESLTGAARECWGSAATA